MGRTPKDKYNIDFMCEKIEEYCKRTKTGIPILKECCLQNDWNYDVVMHMQRENENLSQSIKKLHAQKEVILEKGLLANKLNTTGAIFVLKQPCHGWTDKQSLVHNFNEQEDDALTKAIKSIAEGLNKNEDN